MLAWWHSRTRRQQTLIAACFVVVAVQWVVIAHRRATALGDFDVSREFGRRFVAHEDLYAGGLHYPYMPTAAMYFSPLALIDANLGLALRYDCSAVLILALLLSPATWVQHMVFMLPALYLIVAEDRGIRKLGAPAATAMAAYVVLALLLNREFLGRARYIVLLGYGAQTACMLVVLAVIMRRAPTASPHADAGAARVLRRGFTWEREPP